jgi:hypothetical protein
MAAYGPSNAFVPGRFNIWLPNQTSNAFLSFDTAAEAQTAQNQRANGVILDPAGKVDPKLQAWSGWTTFQAQVPQVAPPVVLSTPSGTTPATPRPGAAPAIPTTPSPQSAPTSGQYNVFVPTAYYSYAGIATGAGSANLGAFLAFSSQADAQAFASSKGVGVIVDPQGNVPAAAQSWVQWGTYVLPLEALHVSPNPTSGKFSVWFPQMYLSGMGISNVAPYKSGAYLAFDTQAEAEASVARRSFGVVLTPQGTLGPTQPMGNFQYVFAQIPGMASQLSATPPAGKYSVWVPGSSVYSIGVQNPAQYPYGTYTAFNSAPEAAAFAKTLANGYVLTPAGDLDATQPNANAAAFAPLLLNPKLTATPTAGQFNVWFPLTVLSNLGMNDVQRFASGKGAYLAFPTEAEAQAHAKARTFGVVLDASGAATATQAWAAAPQALAQLLNDKLTPTRTPGQYSVWFPASAMWGLGLSNPGKFTNGAYLSFATAAEAQAHATARGLGVILDPQGNLDAKQTWAQAPQFGAQLLNAQLAARPVAGQFNVWFPPGIVGSLGITDATPYAQSGAYLGFKTEAEAQAHETARTFGIILDAAGKPAATQPWSYAPQFMAQMENPRLAAKPTPGQFNVWFPGQYAYQLGVQNPTQFQAGAYLSYATEAEAQAHAKARGFGVVLDTTGAAAATQTWAQAPQFLAQLLNSKLTPKRTDGQWSVWIPQAYLPNTGVTDVKPFTEGAYLSFATEAEATAHAKARGMGVVLDPKGDVGATQAWYAAPQFAAQRLNSKLVATEPKGQFYVWFPQQYLGSIGVTDAKPYSNGAFLAFATDAEAQAHAKARGVGVVFDASGQADATQPWAYSNQFLAQRLNPQLTPQRTDGKYSLWFPQNTLGNIGVTTPANFPQGAYLAFNSKAEALAHLKMRGSNFGVMVNEKGVLDTTQLWPGALDAAVNNPALQPPPPSGWVGGPAAVDVATATKLGNPTAGSVAIGSITPTKNGADVVAYVATVRPPDSFRFFVGAQINGNWMPIFNIPDLVRLSGAGWNAFTLHLDYAQIDTYLKGVNPSLGVQDNMNGAIGIRFTSGHDTGIPGWSQNQGTEKDAITTLPAKMAPAA